MNCMLMTARRTEVQEISWGLRVPRAEWTQLQPGAIDSKDFLIPKKYSAHHSLLFLLTCRLKVSSSFLRIKCFLKKKNKTQKCDMLNFIIVSESRGADFFHLKNMGSIYGTTIPYISSSGPLMSSSSIFKWNCYAL